MLDHLETGEEEEQREPEVGKKGDVLVHRGDIEPFGPDEDPEDDLHHDGRHDQPEVPPRQHRAERRAQEHEDERAALLLRQLGGEREVEHVIERERHDLARVRAGRGAADALTIGDSCEVEIHRAPPPLAHRLVESSELA